MAAEAERAVAAEQAVAERAVAAGGVAAEVRWEAVVLSVAVDAGAVAFRVGAFRAADVAAHRALDPEATRDGRVERVGSILME